MGSSPQRRDLIYLVDNSVVARQTHPAVAAVLPLAATNQADVDRAAEVMGLLARAGLHRAVPVPDLILAAIAGRHGLVVLHYDQDFDHIAQVTGWRTTWVVPQGSVP